MKEYFFLVDPLFSPFEYRCDSDGGTRLQVCGGAGKKIPPRAIHKVNH